jgi:gliding motility-associated-like protein
MLRQVYVTTRTIQAMVDMPVLGCDSLGVTIQAADMSQDPLHGIAGWDWRLTGPNSNALADTSSLQQPDFLIKKAGDYTLRLIVTSGNGCQDTMSLPIQAKIPALDLFKDQFVICAGDSVRLYPKADTTFDYAWSPADFLDATHISNPLAAPPVSMEYIAQISDSICTWQRNVGVMVLRDDDLVVTATPSEVYSFSPVQLMAQVPQDINGAFLWSPSAGLSDPQVFNPIAKIETSTAFYVTVTLENGCQLRGSVFVNVLPQLCDENFVFFPTGFSPNGDGENDQLRLESNYVQEVYWAVFNRWGERVFEADELTDAWDGTFRGQPQAAETYAFYLRVVCIGGEIFTRKGNVTLLR